jgi:hypothetical protein
MHHTGHFREAFVCALEAYLVGTPQPLAGFWYDEATQQAWDGMDGHVPALAVDIGQAVALHGHHAGRCLQRTRYATGLYLCSGGKAY